MAPKLNHGDQGAGAAEDTAIEGSHCGGPDVDGVPISPRLSGLASHDLARAVPEGTQVVAPPVDSQGKPRPRLKKGTGDTTELQDARDQNDDTPELVADFRITLDCVTDPGGRAHILRDQVEDDSGIAKLPMELRALRKQFETFTSKSEKLQSVLTRRVNTVEYSIKERQDRERSMTQKGRGLDFSDGPPETADAEVCTDPMPVPVAISRPPTSPRPFSSSHGTKARPQGKASWQSDHYYSVAVTPNYTERGDQESSLVHRGLEEELTSKVLAQQPRYESLGYNTVVIQDMANAVVREIVGIFESLLDRLLLEKKQDVIRTMVAELLTEDIAGVISSGREQLKKQEMGHIIEEYHKLYAYIDKLEVDWDKKFRITQELMERQDDLWVEMDERFKKAEGRLGTIEATLKPISGVDRRMKVAEEHVGKVNEQMEYNIKHIGEMRKSLHNLETLCEDTYSTKAASTKAEERLDGDIAGVVEDLSKGLKELKKHAAAEADMDELRSEHNIRLKELKDAMTLRISRHKELEAVVQKAENLCEETYATKAEHSEGTKVLTKDLRSTEGALQTKLDEMDQDKASRGELSTAESAILASLGKTDAKLADATEKLERTASHVQQLDKHSEDTLATKVALEEVREILDGEIEQREDGKEKVAALSRALDSERERVRQTISQQQHIRKDVNEAITDIHELKTKEEHLKKRCDEQDLNLEGLNRCESGHWEEQIANGHRQRQDLQDLEILYKALREEFLSHVTFQKSEGEKLRHHSTQRFLEQMDKALHLTDSVQSITKEHKELHETVRSIKLPPVRTADSG